MAGTASSLLGLARFAFGGVAAPLIGLGGADDALPLGIVTVVSMTLAVATYGRADARTRPCSPSTVAAAADDARVRDGSALSALADASRPSDLLAAYARGHGPPPRSPAVPGHMAMTEENERYVAVLRAFLREAAE
jgi:hypothetical protein